MTEQYIQGDVMFIKSEKPYMTKEWRALQPTGGVHILARGEKTGHTHTVDANAVDLFEIATGRVVVVKESVYVYHQEHDPLLLPEGEYDVRIQRQYVPQEAPRRVYD